MYGNNMYMQVILNPTQQIQVKQIENLLKSRNEMSTVKERYEKKRKYSIKDGDSERHGIKNIHWL